jgi:uncharacterized protein YigA (DUF484 family)
LCCSVVATRITSMAGTQLLEEIAIMLPDLLERWIERV